MRQVLRKYADAVYVLLTAIDIVTAAVIVDRLNKSEYLPWGLISTILLGASIVVHIVLYRDTNTISKEAQNQVLGNILEIAAKSLVFPESWEVVAIRAFCHRFDRKERKLHYVISRASENFDDQFTDIPVDAVNQEGRLAFVVAEAVVTGRTVFRELPDIRSPAELETHVWSNLRFVLACPVYTMNAARSESSCIGVVSFDTSKEGGDKIKLDGRRAKDVIMQVAATASLLWS
jgi:hypothetical protein